MRELVQEIDAVEGKSPHRGGGEGASRRRLGPKG